MIDWNVAVQTGIRLVRPGPQVSPEDAHQVVAQLRELSQVAQGHVLDFTGMDGALDPSPAQIVDRPGWIKANVDGFRVVLEPLMDELAARRGPGIFSGGAGGAVIQAVGSRVTGIQVGSILAYMAGGGGGQDQVFFSPPPRGPGPPRPGPP